MGLAESWQQGSALPAWGGEAGWGPGVTSHPLLSAHRGVGTHPPNMGAHPPWTLCMAQKPRALPLWGSLGGGGGGIDEALSPTPGQQFPLCKN